MSPTDKGIHVALVNAQTEKDRLHVTKTTFESAAILRRQAWSGEANDWLWKSRDQTNFTENSEHITEKYVASASGNLT